MRCLGLILGIVLVWGGGYARGAEPEALPTRGELQALFDGGQYQPLLQKLARVLALKGNAARAYDRVDLYVLRGETFLQLRQQARAMESFQLGQKELAAPDDPKAPRDPKTAEEQRRALRAVTLLVTRSVNYQYVPRGRPAGGGAAISILDAKQRKAAYAALLNDVKGELAPRVNAARAARTLQPVIDLVRGLGDLRAVEQAATGASAESDALLNDVAGHAGELMADEVARVDKRTDRIASVANERIPLQDLLVGGGRSGNVEAKSRFRLKGLEVQDQKDLREIVETCGKIAAVAHDFAEVGSTSAAAFQKVEKDATAAGQKAHNTLTADYNGVYLDDGKK